MAKSKSRKNSGRNTVAEQSLGDRGLKKFLAPAAIVVMLASAAIIFYYGNLRGRKSSASTPSSSTAGSSKSDGGNVQPGVTTPDMGLGAEPYKMRIAQAVMVTVELDFGGQSVWIADAIQQIERGYAPDDGAGRTFAILDAYGELKPDGKLHMSMHISSEKPGMGTLKFKRTGELLWRARIGNPGDPPAGQKNLMIYLNKGLGDASNYVLDGSRGGGNVLDIYLQNSDQRVRDVWPDGAERELTFIYSACGCPVKVMVRRAGERTVRTRDLPVIFPDDPAAVGTISNLMKW
jgi:hypothetical protein